MIYRNTHRRGFTLLEVILACSISILLLAGLYIALDLQVRMAAAGREKIEKATIVRAIFGRVTRDLLPCVSQTYAINPASSGSSSSSSSSGSGSGSTSTSSTTGSSSTTSSTTSTTSTTPGTNINGVVVVPVGSGVIGSSTQCTIFIARPTSSYDIIDPNSGLPYTTAQQSSSLSADTVQPGDQRRVIYWLGSSSNGLCREEDTWITSDTVEDSTQPDTGNESNYVIAPEVTNLQFEYFDGTNWNDTWDGSTYLTDGVTVMGPPMAIRVHIWIATGKGDESKEYQKVIAILASPNQTTNASVGTSGSSAAQLNGSSP